MLISGCSDGEGYPDCATGEFQCPNGGKCIPNSAVCDGTYDCNDGWDEIGCPIGPLGDDFFDDWGGWDGWLPCEFFGNCDEAS